MRIDTEGQIYILEANPNPQIAHDEDFADSAEKADYHYNLGVAVFRQGRPADALVHVERALELNPDDPNAIGFSTFVNQVLNETVEPEQP